MKDTTMKNCGAQWRQVDKEVMIRWARSKRQSLVRLNLHHREQWGPEIVISLSAHWQPNPSAWSLWGELLLASWWLTWNETDEVTATPRTSGIQWHSRKQHIWLKARTALLESHRDTETHCTPTLRYPLFTHSFHSLHIPIKGNRQWSINWANPHLWNEENQRYPWNLWSQETQTKFTQQCSEERSWCRFFTLTSHNADWAADSASCLLFHIPESAVSLVFISLTELVLLLVRLYFIFSWIVH